MTVRRVVLRTLALAITVALVAWLVADARWQGVGARLARLWRDHAAALAGVAALFAASYAMRGARIFGEFRSELERARGADTGAAGRSYLRILRLTLVHNALVNVLPFRSGEVAFPVLLNRWFGVGTGRAIVSLLWLRCQDAAVVLVLAALVWPRLPGACRVVAVLAIVAAAVAVPAWARHRTTAAAPSSSAVGPKLQALLGRATERAASGWGWTVGNWTVKLAAEAWLVALALAPGPELSGGGDAILGAIGAELPSILPIQGVAGFGTFEAGAAALMRTNGVALATGLEAALALHAVVLGLAVAAGALGAWLLPGPTAVAAAPTPTS